MDSAQWDERYQSTDQLWSDRPNQFLAPSIEHLTPGDALDVAAGEGRNALWLARHGWRTTAVDFSSVACQRSAKRAEAEQLELATVHADLREWEPPARAFDLICVFYYHPPRSERIALFGRLMDALRPGGTFLAVGHDRRNVAEGTGGPQDPRVLWDAAELIEDLKGPLIVEQARCIPRSVEDLVALDTIVQIRRS
ncbi:MAG: class I SAM-dependent methyltransferase [Ferrimicrobium sp.]